MFLSERNMDTTLIAWAATFAFLVVLWWSGRRAKAKTLEALKMLATSDIQVVRIETLPKRAVVFVECPDIDEDGCRRVEHAIQKFIPGSQVAVMHGVKLVGIYEVYGDRELDPRTASKG